MIYFRKRFGRVFGKFPYNLSKLRISAISVTSPNAPTNFAAIGTSSSNINLTWTDNSSDETGFEIEVSTNGSSWSALTTKAANSTSHSHSGLAANSLRYYRIRSVNGGLGSSWSSTAIARSYVADYTASSEASVTADAYMVNEDEFLSVIEPGVLGNDIHPSESLIAVLTANPLYGSLSLGSDGSFNYTPDSDFFGTDFFKYQARDESLLYSTIVTVTIVVVEQPD